MSLLTIRGLEVRYGPVRAVSGLELDVDEGEIISLVGTNGAGKSSLLRAIMGLAPVTAGTIEIADHGQIQGRSCHWIAANCGFAYVPEDRGVFSRLTVRENLELGSYSQRRRGKKALAESAAAMYDLFPRLLERRSQIAGTLSGGEQQMLAMARALVSAPRLLLLDEPSLGLAPIIVAGIFEQLESIRKLGTSILLVEQNSQIAFKVSKRGYVMETGRVVLEGSSSALASDDRVRQAYLGMVTAE